MDELETCDIKIRFLSFISTIQDRTNSLVLDSITFVHNEEDSFVQKCGEFLGNRMKI